MRLKRSGFLAAAGVLGTVLVASSAWAWCSPFTDNSSYVVVEPNRAPAGTEVAVRVGNWAPGPVEVHWASATGAVLNRGLVTNGEISIPVNIPRASSSGNFALVVVHGASQIAAPFVVTSPIGSSGDPIPAGDPTSSSVSTDAAGLIGATQGTDAGVTDSESAGLPTGGGIPQAPGPASSPVALAGSAPAAGAVGGLVGSGPLAFAPNPSGVSAVVVAPEVAEAAVVAAPGVAEAKDAVATPVSPSRPNTDDLWSGLNSAGSMPGLLNVPASRSVADFTILLAMALAGFVALGGGFAVAELRRRPVRAIAIPKD